MIVTLFVASLGATLLVMLCVVLVDVDILGLMWLWGLSIDSVGCLVITTATTATATTNATTTITHCSPSTRWPSSTYFLPPSTYSLLTPA